MLVHSDLAQNVSMLSVHVPVWAIASLSIASDHCTYELSGSDLTHTKQADSVYWLLVHTVGPIRMLAYTYYLQLNTCFMAVVDAL